MTDQTWHMTIEIDHEDDEVEARSTLVAGTRIIVGRGRAARTEAAGQVASSVAARRSFDDLARSMTYLFETPHLAAADQA